jgi:hypothetical protein
MKLAKVRRVVPVACWELSVSLVFGTVAFVGGSVVGIVALRRTTATTTFQ